MASYSLVIFRSSGFWASLVIPVLWFMLCCPLCLTAQSLGAGTLRGTVTDTTGAALPTARIEVSNAITRYSRQTRTGPEGSFVLEDLPLNTYVLSVTREGFQAAQQTVVVRTTVPVGVSIELALAGQQTSITVEAQ